MQAQSLNVENLESRRLLSATFTGNVLRANGDAGIANTITVAYSADKTQYEVTINGTRTSFDVGKLRRIVVHGAELGDTLTVSSELNVRQNIFGYDGNDTITGGSASDELRVKRGHGHGHGRGPRGWTRLWGGGGDDTITATGGRNFLDGGLGNDLLNGSDGRDLIAGHHGNDTVNAGAGNDIVRGGYGDDTINLDDGDDLGQGGEGHDVMNGGEGNDRMFGQNGNDFIHGDAGNDAIFGCAGLDSLFGDAGDDKLIGGADEDSLDGGEGTNKLVQSEVDVIHDLETQATSESV